MNYGPPAGGFGHGGGGAYLGPTQGPGPRPRACSCGLAAPCVDTGPARLGMLRIGKRSAYRCERCGRQFAVRSVFHVIFSLAYSLFVTAFGVLMVVHPPGSAVGAEGENRWVGVGVLVLGLGCLGWAVTMIVAHVRHPER